MQPHREPHKEPLTLRVSSPAFGHGGSIPTDLDYSEVVSGLKATDSVIILPSASLVQSQQEFRQRIGSFANQAVPGMRQATTTPTAPAAAAARPQGGGAPR